MSDRSPSERNDALKSGGGSHKLEEERKTKMKLQAQITEGLEEYEVYHKDERR